QPALRPTSARQPAPDGRSRTHRYLSSSSDPGLRLRAGRCDPQHCQALRVTSSLARPWRAVPDGLWLNVRASSRASRQAVAGVVATAGGPALAVRVHAVAQKGQANRAVELAIATWLGVPKTRVAVTGGGKSRLKTVLVAGESAELARLAEMCLARLP